MVLFSIIVFVGKIPFRWKFLIFFFIYSDPNLYYKANPQTLIFNCKKVNEKYVDEYLSFLLYCILLYLKNFW